MDSEAWLLRCGALRFDLVEDVHPRESQATEHERVTDQQFEQRHRHAEEVAHEAAEEGKVRRKRRPVMSEEPQSGVDEVDQQAEAADRHTDRGGVAAERTHEHTLD